RWLPTSSSRPTWSPSTPSGSTAISRRCTRARARSSSTGRRSASRRRSSPGQSRSVTNVEFGIYIPQIGLSYELLRDRAQLCEELGYSSFWCFDHLYEPGLPQHPALEGWTLATSLLAQTTTLRVGHMVLCATFRHPVLLGKMATTLDVISGGRYELGIGSGSVEGEHDEAG